jgi:hypothetical protein
VWTYSVSRAQPRRCIGSQDVGKRPYAGWSAIRVFYRVLVCLGWVKKRYIVRPQPTLPSSSCPTLNGFGKVTLGVSSAQLNLLSRSQNTQIRGPNPDGAGQVALVRPPPDYLQGLFKATCPKWILCDSRVHRLKMHF